MRPSIGGVERWARELTSRLPVLAPGRYVLAAPPAWASGPAGQVWEQGSLPRIAQRMGAPLILSPANLAPVRFDGNVVVIHDAAAIRDPDWYSAAYARWQRIMLPRIAQRARAIITPSRFSRGEIVDLLGVDEGKVSVVPGGVDGRFTPEADAGAVGLALGLDRPYVLTVASRTSRKNLGALGQASSALRGQGIELVAAGGERSGLRDSGLPGAVRSLGMVPDALLPGLYAGAKAFVLPSLHEGFGLTALEAMRSGVPAVVSDAGALREVCGEAATYVDPNDPAAIAAAVVAAAGREGVDAKAMEVASRFTWERTAEAVNRVVDSVLPT